MRHLIIIMIAVGLYTQFSLATCLDLVDELKAMKKAQISVNSALITNHELFATTLESYSDSVSGVSGRSQKMLAMNMNKSADSFRGRGLKAQKTSLKLAEATDDLIQRLTDCLK